MHKSQQHKCSVISPNVRGLRDTVKRRSIFTYLKDQEANFDFLQIYFSHGTSHSKGVCILINRAVKEKVTFTSSVADGRTILINLTHNGLKLSFCNIYAPNDHTTSKFYSRTKLSLGILHFLKKKKKVVRPGGQQHIGI